VRNWRRNRNFRKCENADGSYTHTVTVDGEDVEVSAEVYKEYATGSRKMEYMEFDLKRDRVLKDTEGKAVLDENGLPFALPEREVSLDKLIDEDWDYKSSEPSPEDAFISAVGSEVEELHRCITLLTNDEQALIKALFFEGIEEQAYADMLGIKRQNVNKRKLRILKKIKKFLREGC
jgi:RNA polymerase sigma factor (sigma-70 family)